jgi:hypothetical protein
MSALINKLTFIKNTTTWAEMSRQSGIPYRKLLALKNQTIAANDFEKRVIRNYYQRTGYKILRESGYSAIEATRWSWNTPSKVNAMSKQIEAKIQELTYGKVRERFEFWEEDLKGSKFKEEFNKVYEAIKEGMRKSFEPTERILDY